MINPSRPLIAFAGLAALALLVYCSSSNEGSCPQCLPGQTCSAATNFQCVGGAAGCPPAGCGAGASCRADNVCACDPGFVDCNQNLGAAGSDGCECTGGCNGAACGAAGACDPSALGACGGDTSFCSAGTCTQCPPSMFNCDGVNDCETTGSCNPTASCNPSQPGACGKAQYCNAGNCATCPPGTYNCDGINDCESSQACGCDVSKAKDCGDESQYCTANATCAACPAGKYNCDGTGLCESDAACAGTGPGPGGCDKECNEDRWATCVKNPARNNYCSECLASADCTRNPTSKGTVCDSSDLAGTGVNWCICANASDCAGNWWGKKCLYVPNGNNNPKFMQCGCESDADCPATTPHCLPGTPGYTIGKCTPRCTTPADCDGITAGTGLYFCSQSEGKCEASEGF